MNPPATVALDAATYAAAAAALPAHVLAPSALHKYAVLAVDAAAPLIRADLRAEVRALRYTLVAGERVVFVDDVLDLLA